MSRANNDDDGDGDDSMFSCRIESSKTISDILTCLCMNRKDHLCHIEASPESLTFVVTGKAKSTQARVNLEADLFDEYMCDSPSIRLALNLNMLLDCLEIFGSSSENTTATMTYSVSHYNIVRLSLSVSVFILFISHSFYHTYFSISMRFHECTVCTFECSYL